MEIIRQSAWKLLLEYGGTRPLELNDLFEICAVHGWDIYPYSKATTFIKMFPDLGEKVKTCSAVTHISEDLTVILYQDSLASVTKRTAIAHEIGHICLKHISYGNKGRSSFTDAQEREADVFAYELLLPSIIIKSSGIRTPSQLRKLGLLNEEGINYAISAVQDRLDELPGNLESQVIQRFSGFIRENKIRFGKDTYRKHVTKRLSAIPLLLLITFTAYIIYQRTNVLPAAVPNDLPAASTQVAPVVEEQQGTVYITRSGSKYHKAECRYLSDKAFAITTQEAEQVGLEPCKVCKPKLE